MDSCMPTLAPLRHSHDANALEADLKQLVLFLFETTLRDKERELNVYGVPHLGSLALIERHVKREGLALIRTQEPAMRYLFKAWRARNPKRGLHFLRLYLQLLWPGGWTVEQLWQDKNKPYPTALHSAGSLGKVDPSDTHYLTSRIRISIDDEGELGFNIPLVAPALRAVIAAKYVLEIALLKRFENISNSGIGLSNGSLIQTFFNAEGALLLSQRAENSDSNSVGLLNGFLMQRFFKEEGSALLPQSTSEMSVDGAALIQIFYFATGEAILEREI